MKTLFQLPKAFFQSVILIKRLKAQVILGTGGAVSYPVVMAGFFLFRKTAIWEGNAIMGLANKYLTPFVSSIFTVFQQKKGFLSKKQISCAYPLRQSFKAKSLMQTEDKNLEEEGPNFTEGLKNTNLTQAKKIFKVLVLGGSQGSVFINQVVSQAVEQQSWRKNIFIYHQTGDKSFNEIQVKYRNLIGVSAFPFSLNIEKYYQECDLIFSRAGSGVIAETGFHGKALVLIPLTYSAGGHQMQNALELFSKNCVEMISEKDFNVKVFKDKIIQLKQDEKRKDQLGKNLNKFCHGDGAGRVVDWILKALYVQSNT